MRQGIIIGICRETGSSEPISGMLPYDQARTTLRELAAEPSRFDQLEIWTRSGLAKAAKPTHRLDQGDGAAPAAGEETVDAPRRRKRSTKKAASAPAQDAEATATKSDNTTSESPQ